MFVAGFLPHVTKCTMDSSWFVKKAAVDVISKILSNSKPNTLNSAACNTILSDEEQEMIATVFAPMMTDEICDVNQFSVCLEILNSRDLLISVCSLLHLDKAQIVERLCILLNCLSASLSCDGEKRVLDILASVCEAYEYLSEAKQRMVQLVTTLLSDGKILSAVIVAVWVLERFVAIYR